jgi:hypothetical protein
MSPDHASALRSLALLSALALGSVPSVHGQTPQRFETRQVPVASGTWAVALGDWTGEGELDLVAGADDLRLWRGDGGGAFCPPELLASVPGRQVVGADLELDGDLDLVAAGIDMTVLLNAGLGALVVSGTHGSAGHDDVGLGDLDGDGLPDAVLVGASPGAEVLLNTGGGFGAPASVFGALEGTAIVCVDLDNDGHLDLVASDLHAGLAVLPGDGTGDFSTAVPVITTLPAFHQWWDVAVGDLDGDGWRDVVVVGGPVDTVAWLPNLGAGVLGTPQVLPASGTQYGVVLADLDTDFDVDIVTCGSSPGRLTVHDNLFGAFAAGVAAPGVLGMTDLAVGDLDGDLIPDLVASAAFGGGLPVLEGDGGGGFRGPEHLDMPLAHDLFEVATGDLDGDGWPDAVATGGVDDLVRFSSGGPSGLGPPTTHPSGWGSCTGLALLDSDGDLDLDVVYARENAHMLGRLVGDGAGGLSQANGIPSGIYPRGVAAGDLDGDGDRDVVVSNRDVADGAGTHENLGTGALGPRVSAGHPYWCMDVELGDLDGDGVLDAALASTSPGSHVTTLQGDGSGTLVSWGATAVALPQDLALGDVTHDGVLDVVVASIGSDASRLLPGLGDGTFGAAIELPTPAGSWGVAVADVDNDTVQDVVVTNLDGLGVSIFQGDGLGSVGARDAYVVGADAAFLAVDDMNLDGRADLLVIAEAGSGLTLLEGQTPPAGTIADLGHGLAGAAGVPVLTASGTLAGGSFVTLDLHGALHDAPAWYVFSFCFLNAPLKGGTLVPDPSLGVITPLTVGPLGTIGLFTTWPHGVPSGVAVYNQYWIQDGVGPKGFSASNALKLTTP